MVFTTPGDGKMRKDRQGCIGDGGRWTNRALSPGNPVWIGLGYMLSFYW